MIYAIVGDSFQQVGGTCPTGMVEMKDFRPEGDYVASDTGDWILREKTADEVRDLRNKKLSETDWMVLPDSPYKGDQLAAILKYRQELRDIPETNGFPDVTFPDLVIPTT